MKEFKQGNTGLIKLILLIIIAILVLSYYSIDIRGIAESPQAQANFHYITGWLMLIWNDYLAHPVLYFWNNIFVNLLWSSFVDNLEKIKRGELNDFGRDAPQVPFTPLPQ